MNLEEKLKHFEEVSIEEAQLQSEKIISDHKAALDQIFEEHKEKKLRQSALQIKTESERLQRLKNKELSSEQLLLKKTFNIKQKELVEMLFAELTNLLGDYTSTSEYDALLIRQINQAKAFARGEEIIIYIDPADSSRHRSLEVATNTKLTVSEYSFMGGTRAVIPSKNVLIDNSFASRISELKTEFTFNGGVSNE
ncbi:V-type ATP synthase subunit E [Anaerobium acetethylicum]|uniref:H+-ATPase subunit E/Vma4 n=1 Tax=Anaerobium acetethylicum TaxID=1619234 RepID=A0A1D3TRP5_9FIRM|nr:V-type ATP synthase subunit E [Anaerobium acetethylicum]SCP96421.1 H+-ATPase subunit E/Vma4 [Anaerobium acetethylicum]